MKLKTAVLLLLLPGAVVASEPAVAETSSPVAAAPKQENPPEPNPAGENQPPASEDPSAPTVADKPADGVATTAPTSQQPATSAGSAVLTPEQLAALSGFFYSASIDHSLGLGTFIDATKYASLYGTANAFISYRTQIKGRAFALGIQPFGLNGITYEYTLPDSPTGRRITYSDLRLALSMPAVLRDKRTGIALTPSLQWIIPTTPESWQASLISRLGVGLSINRNTPTPIGLLIANVGGIATFGIYRYTANVVTQNNIRDNLGYPVQVCRQGESFCAIAGNNTFLSAQGSAGLTLAASDYLFFSIGYGLVAQWKYAVTNTEDDFTPKATDSSGERVGAVGMASTLSQSASVSMSFQITDAISGTIYLANFAPLRTADQKAVRFPWLDAVGLANNNSSVGFSLNATY